MGKSFGLLSPVFLLFVIINALIFAFSGKLQDWGIDKTVLLVANVIVLALTVLIFSLQKKALSHSNPNVFIRSVMGGMMIKMIACAIAVVIYVVSIGPGYNKKAVFISLFIYLLYLAVEVRTMTRLNNNKNA